MTADSIRAPVEPRSRSARPTGPMLLPAVPPTQPGTGALLGAGGGAVASDSRLLAPVFALVPACRGGRRDQRGEGPGLSRRVSPPIREGVRSSPEAQPSTPEVVARALRRDGGLSGGVGSPIREGLARRSAIGARYPADRRGLSAGQPKREIFGLASPSALLASTSWIGRQGLNDQRLGLGDCRLGLGGGRPGLGEGQRKLGGGLPGPGAGRLKPGGGRWGRRGRRGHCAVELARPGDWWSRHTPCRAPQPGEAQPLQGRARLNQQYLPGYPAGAGQAAPQPDPPPAPPPACVAPGAAGRIRPLPNGPGTARNARPAPSPRHRRKTSDPDTPP